LEDIACTIAKLGEEDKPTLIEVTRAVRPWSEVLNESARRHKHVNGN
jgi:hypothetical protein